MASPLTFKLSALGRGFFKPLRGKPRRTTQGHDHPKATTVSAQRTAQGAPPRSQIGPGHSPRTSTTRNVHHRQPKARVRSERRRHPGATRTKRAPSWAAHARLAPVLHRQLHRLGWALPRRHLRSERQLGRRQRGPYRVCAMPKLPPPVRTRPRRFPPFWLLVLLAPVLGAGTALLFRQGLVPAVLNPLPALDLGQADAWFVDWRLAALRHDPQLCRRVLTQPYIAAEPIAD